MSDRVPYQQLTLAKQLAVAVLNDDSDAAYALADLVIEDHLGNQGSRAAAQAAVRNAGGAHDGYSVYHWPEFRDFARRLGVMYDLGTIDLTIHIAEGERVVITQRYAGQDVPAETVLNLREKRKT